MIVKFDEYINESIGEKLDQYTLRFQNKLRELINYPILKYTKRKIKNLSDKEKLLVISKISNNLDRIFSPMKNNILVGVLALMGASLGIAKEMEVTWTSLYLYFIFICAYTYMSKKYRLLAKDMFKYIKNEYIKKYNLNNWNDNIHLEIDPLGEEDWAEDDDIISQANKIRYNKQYTELEDMPYIGLGNKKDIEPY